MLLKLAEIIIKHHKKILIICGIFTLLCMFWITKLKLNMQMMDMLPDNEPTVKTYNSAIKNFEGIDTIVVVVQGEEKNIISFIEDVKNKINLLPNISRLIYKTETEFLEKHGLLLTKEREINSLKDMLKASNLKDFVRGINNNFEKEYIETDQSNKLSKDRQVMLGMFNTIEDFVKLLSKKNPETQKIIDVSDEFFRGKKYMISPDRSLGLLFIHSALSATDIEGIMSQVNNVEHIIKTNQKTYNVKSGLAGFLTLQRDEMVTCERDMAISSIFSVILILIIFILGFRLIRYSVLAIIPLLVGIIWSMGITYIVVGSLSIMTAMMGAILIGLGIDYSIHIISLFTEERRKGTLVFDSIRYVFQKAVKGIITGSTTTAIGFMAFVLSSFPGFREFGIVLGLGIISILIASILILPSLLIIYGTKNVKRIESKKSLFLNIEKIVLHKPKYVIFALIVLIILSIIKLKDIEFSKDIKDIEAKNLESLLMTDIMIEKFDFSSDSSIVISKDLNEARRIKKIADDIDSVSFIESIATYLPSDEKQDKRLAILKRIKKSVKRLPDKYLYLSSLKSELERLNNNIIEISDLSYMSGEEKLVKKCDALIESNIIENLKNNINENKKSLENIQEIFISNFKQKVLNMNTTERISINDLPESIKKSYIGKDGTFLTTIYPEGDVWDENFQELFLNEIENSGIPFTGTFILSSKVMNIAGIEGKRILLIVVFVIFLVLMFDFKSFKYAVLAMIPMVLTLVFMIGIMSWFKIKFNYVNIIALPIIIGIGVDDGVHIIHRYLIENNILPALKSTGRAIFLTTLTTSAAFGTLMISLYQGFITFGMVLVLGICLAYLLTILLLTSLIVVIDKKKI